MPGNQVQTKTTGVSLSSLADDSNSTETVDANGLNSVKSPNNTQSLNQTSSANDPPVQPKGPPTQNVRRKRSNSNTLAMKGIQREVPKNELGPAAESNVSYTGFSNNDNKHLMVNNDSVGTHPDRTTKFGSDFIRSRNDDERNILASVDEEHGEPEDLNLKSLLDRTSQNQIPFRHQSIDDIDDEEFTDIYGNYYICFFWTHDLIDTPIFFFFFTLLKL